MENDYKLVSDSIYNGMSIFNTIVGCKISFGSYRLNLEDKKYISLYLGIINSKNEISDSIEKQNLNIDIKYSLLNNEDYLKIYNNYFVDILNEINFLSLTDYYNYLMDKNSIKLFNEINNIKRSNKTLIKK